MGSRKKGLGLLGDRDTSEAAASLSVKVKGMTSRTCIRHIYVKAYAKLKKK